MPGVEVALSEALEVLGGAIKENEVWALLCQAVEALQDLFLHGGSTIADGSPFLITTDSLLLNGNGRVRFARTPIVNATNFLPPEFRSNKSFTDEGLEKIYVFSLGFTLYTAADFKLPSNQKLQLSDELDSLLSAMCDEDPQRRMALIHILEKCTNRCHGNKLSNSHYVIKLYKLVLGSDQNLDVFAKEECIPQKRQRRSKERKDSRRSHYNNGGHSRSRSRSRSRSADRLSSDRRGQPVGRDDDTRHRRRREHSFLNRHGNEDNTSSIHGSRRSLASRRVLSELRPDLCEQGTRGVTMKRSKARVDPVSRAMTCADPQQRSAVQQMYDRLHQRRYHLNQLRRGIAVSCDETDISDIVSLRSDITDIGDARSLISAVSYTPSVYQPDVLSRYTTDKEHFVDDESLWLDRQKRETSAMVLRGTVGRPEKQPSRTSPTSSIVCKQPSVNMVTAKPPRPTRPSVPKDDRKFYGPEFVNVNKVTTLHVPQARHVDVTNQRHLQVKLLSGEALDVVCEPSSTGQQVLDLVVSHIGLPQHYLFGLCFLHDGEYFFVEHDTKLHKVAPSKWKDAGKSRAPTTPFILHFRVKFYVTNTNALCAITCHQLYLQLRHDLLDDRISCSPAQAQLLAALSLQAEWGCQTNGYHTPELYLPPRVLAAMGRDKGGALMREEHIKHAGLSEVHAQLAFVQEMQKLSEYGIHFYQVYKSKKDLTSPIWTGIGVQGVVMCDRRGNGERVITRRHLWGDTQKISFNRRRFSIQPKSEAGPLRSSKLNYFTDSYRKGRYLLHLCREHHRFELKLRITLLPNLSDMIEEEYPFEAGGDHCDTEDTVTLQGDTEQIGDTPGQIDDTTTDQVVADQNNDSFDDFSDGDHQMTDHHYANIHYNDMKQTRPKSVMSLTSQKQPTTINTEPLSSRFNTPLSQAVNSDRRIAIVSLYKSASCGIGITLVSAATTAGCLDLGIFVRSVTHGGPAERDGRVHAGDRVIAINGRSLEGVTLATAVDMIRDSLSQVVLVISQEASKPQDDVVSEQMTQAKDVPLPTLSVDSSDIELEDVLPSSDTWLLRKPECHHPDQCVKTTDAVPTSDTQQNVSCEALGNQASDTSQLAIGQRYEVTLTKINGSLGLNVTGGVNTSVKFGGIYVKSLTKDGPAQLNGRIHVGDRVLQVDDVTLDGVTHRCAVETLRATQHTCVLLMEKGVPLGTHPTPSPGVQSGEDSSDEDKQMDSDDDKMDVEYPFVDKDNVYILRLTKGVSGLGFSVIGGYDDDDMHVTRVKRIFPIGPAKDSGVMCEGDVILRVNGTATKRLPRSETMHLLRTTSSDGVVELLMCRPADGVLPSIEQLVNGQSTHFDKKRSNIITVGDDEQRNKADLCNQSESSHKDHIDMAGDITSDRSVNRSDDVGHGEMTDGNGTEEEQDESSSTDTIHASTAEYSVTLTKGEHGLGFTIAGGVASHGVFYVKDVLYEPALSTHQIRSGDRLTHVDDEDIREMTHREAISFLRATPSTVRLHFIRDADDKLASTEDGVHHGKHRCSMTRVEENTVREMVGKMDRMSVNAEDTQEDEEEDRGTGLINTVSSWGEITLPMPEDLHEDDHCTDNKLSSCGVESGVLCIELEKSAEGSLGFSLVQGGKRPSSGLFVKSISPGGVACNDGQLRVGDRLLQVNGESVIGMAHSKAVCLIKRAPSSVVLAVSRQPPVDDNVTSATISHDSHMISEMPDDVISPRDSTNLDDLVVANQLLSDMSHVQCVTSDNGHDTDSDIDSTMLDSELDTQPCIVTKTGHTEHGEDAAQSDDEDSWVTQSQDVSEDEERWIDDEIKHPSSEQTHGVQTSQKPQKPPRKSALSRLPADISDTWLQTLALVRPPAQTLHYTGRQLVNKIQQLRLIMERDEPVEEYKSLRRVKQTDNCTEARRPENKCKNRYRNVLPYDSTRVRLAASGTDDYINASYLRHLVGNDRLSYIACQGPMPTTTEHFWLMVWQQKADTVAMVTLATEAGKVKCDHYWPTSTDEPMLVDNRLQVSLSHVHTFSHFTVHHIRMADTQTSHEHRVTHLNFTSWPDLGTPDSGIPLLQYMAFMHLVHQSGPVVVHCSAGIGRTGALITIDIVLALIHRDLQFDIQNIVQELRRQRQGMIQTKDQYTFCYQACLEALLTLPQQ